MARGQYDIGPPCASTQGRALRMRLRPEYLEYTRFLMLARGSAATGQSGGPRRVLEHYCWPVPKGHGGRLFRWSMRG